MNAATERDLLRLLHGELPPEQARVLSRRLAAEPDLAAAYRRLEGLWQGLELPPPSPVPLGFAGRVAARARALRRPEAGLRAAPVWVRAAAGLALALGLGLGVGVGLLETARTDEGLSAWGSNLAETYWEAVEADLVAASEAPEEVAR